MGKGSSPPPAPDPTQTAQAQSQYDQQTAQFNANLNRYNVNTPFGSQTWQQTQGTVPRTTFDAQAYLDANPDVAAAVARGEATAQGHYDAFGKSEGRSLGTMPGPAQYTQNISLTPTAQATLDQTQGNALGLAQTQGQLLSNARAGMGSPMDFSNIPGLATNPGYSGPGFATGVNAGGPGYASSVNAGGPGYATSVNSNGPGYAGPVAQGDLTGLANKATQASFDSSMALLSPQMDIDRKAQIQDLANRGIPMGSEGYQNAMGSMERQQDFTRTQAANNATLSGMQYQNQLFNQGATNANFQNQAQQGNFAQGATNAGLQNNAQQNIFSQGLANAGLQNTAQQGIFNQGLANAGLQNNAQSQGFDQAMASTNLNNSAQAQAMQQLFATRNQPLNEYAAMLQGTQIQTPQFQSTPVTSAAAPNYQQAVQNQYQGQLNAFNTETGSSNSMTSGLMSMAAAAMMAY